MIGSTIVTMSVSANLRSGVPSARTECFSGVEISRIESQKSEICG